MTWKDPRAWVLLIIGLMAFDLWNVYIFIFFIGMAAYFFSKPRAMPNF